MSIRRLTQKAFYRPAVNATANQFAEIGRLIMTCAKKEGSYDLKRRSVDAVSFVNWANQKGKGGIFKKMLFSDDQKLTAKGKKWFANWIGNMYGLEAKATLHDIWIAGMSKLRNMQR